MFITLVRWVSLVGAVFLLSVAILRFGGWIQVHEIRIVFVNAIDHRGPGYLSPQEVKNLTAIEPGANMLKLDVGEAVRRLRADPWVKRAAIKLSWLRRQVEVYIEERKPVGRVQGEGGKAFWVDSEGVLLGPAADDGTPVIRFDAPLSDRFGEGNPDTVWAARVLSLYRRLPRCEKYYPRLDATDPEDVVLLPADEAWPDIRMGPRDAVSQTLPRVEALLAAGLDLASFGEVDCRLGDACVLRPRG